MFLRAFATATIRACSTGIPPPTTVSKTPSAMRSMSTTSYRKKMTGYFEPDQNVNHIVAKSNGGADHPDNYLFLSREFNELMNNKCDHINCYLAGPEKCSKAVEASRALTGYSGPSAEELFARGNRAMRGAFRQLRDGY
jgi:hypothetical protein